MSDDDETIGELATREGWPVLTLAYRGHRMSVQIPAYMFEDAPALAGFMRDVLNRLAEQSRTAN